MAKVPEPTNRAWAQTESLLLLRRVMGLGDEVRRVVSSRSHLSATELNALEHLTGAPMGPADLARRLDVSTAATTGIVDRLEAKGHVHRQPHPADRRRTTVVVTDSARAEVMGHLGPMFGALAAADAHLTDAEREVVVRYLRAAVAAAEAVTLAGQDVGLDKLDRRDPQNP